MNKSENMFFKILDIFAHFVLLNALWVICCIPIFTIFPATTALFGVVRKWHVEGTDVGVVRIFFQLFKTNFKKSFIIGLIWLLAGFILYFDLSIVLQIDFTGKIFVFILLIFSSILYVFMTIYIFFILVHQDLTIVQSIKNALFMSIGYYLHTFLIIAILIGALAITYLAPIFLMVIGSVLAFSIYQVFQRVLNNRTMKASGIHV
jgi:uncharacterized membrane protein YesL